MPKKPPATLGIVYRMPLEDLHPHPLNPYGVRDDPAMQELMSSVKANGVLIPAIARPRKEGGYELISGHRRKYACEQLGQETMPVMVLNMKDDDAIIRMIDSNIQRENILPSERARAYKLKMEAMKRQGMMRNLLAFDLGASNGRAILGQFDGNRLTMRELHRFENNYVEMNGVFYWDLPYLYNQLKQGFLAFKRADVGNLDCFGIDTWGVDYGLIDANGQLLSNPRSYRYAVDEDMLAVWERVDFPTLFAHTGIASMNFNTVYQLYRRKRQGDPALAAAEKMLFMPDLLGFFLTGEDKSEYTNATTSMLYNPIDRNWDWKIIDALKLPRKIFTEIDHAGSIRGRLRPELAEELGINQAPFAAVGTHDTASAVAAIPGKGSFAFCSSGTWSLFGVETETPILTDAVRDANFSNEGTVQGGFRPLKNIMGLWLIQECRREWQKAGMNYSWDEIVAEADRAEPFRSIIDPDYGDFYAGGRMAEKIQEFCRRTRQPIPQTVGQIARCIYESLALKYRWALERLEEIKGRRIDTLNIVGGGCKNRLLNQFAADAINRPVIAGPVEGSAIGNLLVQAKALGDICSVDELRSIVRCSESVEEYRPNHTVQWENAYTYLCSLLK